MKFDLFSARNRTQNIQYLTLNATERCKDGSFSVYYILSENALPSAVIAGRVITDHLMNATYNII